MTTTAIVSIVALSAAALLWVGCSTGNSGYQTAAYTATKTEGTFEIRSYPAMTVATTANTDKGRDGRFMKLFGYISGKNESKEKIEMTTPVFMEGDEMAFVMPDAVAKKGAPKAAAADVNISTKPARTMAVYRYSGWSNSKLETAAKAKLLAWMKSQNLEAAGESVVAGYNPPWTLGPLRRNEILIPIKK
jgi:effector-binding domain-containing protein